MKGRLDLEVVRVEVEKRARREHEERAKKEDDADPAKGHEGCHQALKEHGQRSSCRKSVVVFSHHAMQKTALF